MKQIKVNLIILISVLIFLILSCSRYQPDVSDDLQKSFEQLIPMTRMNTYFRINNIDDDVYNSGSNVKILVENISEQSIFFSVDEQKPSVEIYVIEKDKWVKVPNKTTYFSMMGGDGSVLLPSKLFTTFVSPNLEFILIDEDSEKFVRILFIGELVSDGEKTGTLVGAYVDVFMEP